MIKAGTALLALAMGLLALGENEALSEAVKNFEAVGDGIKKDDEAFVALETLVAELKPKDEPKKEETLVAEDEPVNYFHIRMIGNKYYHKEDGYKKGFGTSKECALHFNGKK